MDELLARMKVRLRFDSTTEDAMLTDHLQSAIEVVNERRNYTSTDEAIVEPQYKGIVVDLAIATYNKMGAEGQTSHSENGISRSYEAASYPTSLLALVMVKPKAGYISEDA